MGPRRRHAALALAAALTACASPPPTPRPLKAPDLARTDRIRPASGLGAASAPEGARARDAGLDLEVRALWLERAVSDPALVPFASTADLVLDLAGGEVALDTPELTVSCLAATGTGAADVRASLSQLEAVTLLDAARAVPLREPTTWELRLEAEERVEDPRDWLDEFPDRGPFPRAVTLELTPLAGRLGVTLRVTDLDPGHEAALLEDLVEDPARLPSTPPAPYDEELRTEAVRASFPLADDGRVDLVLQLDPPFGPGGTAALAFVVRGRRIPETTGALLEASDARAAAAEASRAAGEPYTEAAAGELVRAEALRSFQARGGRAALLALGLEVDAELASDLALVARPEDLADLASRAFPTDAQGGEGPGASDVDNSTANEEPNSLRWRLESSAWRMLAERALEDELAPELTGVLLRHAGALARYPDVLIDGLRASGGSVDAFHARLFAEQRLALEESGAQARVRAHDWLTARGAAVPGYDPLDARDARRSALEAAQEDGR
ncbi:MAG: hypothetical protein AAFU73_21900 [Planctomycetota bacterium]